MHIKIFKIHAWVPNAARRADSNSDDVDEEPMMDSNVVHDVKGPGSSTRSAGSRDAEDDSAISQDITARDSRPSDQKDEAGTEDKKTCAEVSIRQ